MKLLSTKEVAAIIDMPESTLRYWRCAGLGPSYVKLGGRIRYDEADVDAYVQANKRIPSVRASYGGRVHGSVSA
ncbi:MAG: helix-turn-helix transcriptional regulator [Acidobacteriaceae bacterium]